VQISVVKGLIQIKRNGEGKSRGRQTLAQWISLCSAGKVAKDQSSIVSGLAKVREVLKRKDDSRVGASGKKPEGRTFARTVKKEK